MNTIEEYQKALEDLHKKVLKYEQQIKDYDWETVLTIEFPEDDRVATTLRIPRELRDLIEEDVWNLKKKEKKHFSMNEYMLRLLLRGGNYSYSERNENFYRKRNGFNFDQRERQGD